MNDPIDDTYCIYKTLRDKKMALKVFPHVGAKYVASRMVLKWVYKSLHEKFFIHY